MSDERTWPDFLADLRGYLLACIGDVEGQRAVERHTVLRLTAGQVQVLAEARNPRSAVSREGET